MTFSKFNFGLVYKFKVIWYILRLVNTWNWHKWRLFKCYMTYDCHANYNCDKNFTMEMNPSSIASHTYNINTCLILRSQGQENE